jgi:uncharacterized protein (DUF2344 family)
LTIDRLTIHCSRPQGIEENTIEIEKVSMLNAESPATNQLIYTQAAIRYFVLLHVDQLRESGRTIEWVADPLR